MQGVQITTQERMCGLHVQLTLTFLVVIGLVWDHPQPDDAIRDHAVLICVVVDWSANAGEALAWVGRALEVEDEDSVSCFRDVKAPQRFRSRNFADGVLCERVLGFTLCLGRCRILQ